MDLSKQIESLKQSGLIIQDVDKAKEILSDIGFYRLGFYLFPFEKKYPTKARRDHILREGITLETVLKLYYFDFELRQILLRYISRIEIHLRTTVVNYMSEEHHNKETWFVDDSIVSPAYIRSFGKIYDRVRLSPYIKWHHHNHSCKYAPAWKTLEFMSLGEILDLLSSITNVKDRLEISRHFGIRSLKTFGSYMHAIRRIRNRCAHGGVLFDYMANIRLVTGGPVDLSNVYDRFTLKGAIDVIEYLVGIVSINRRRQFRDEMERLILECKDDSELYNVIRVSSGLK